MAFKDFTPWLSFKRKALWIFQTIKIFSYPEQVSVNDSDVDVGVKVHCCGSDPYFWTHTYCMQMALYFYFFITERTSVFTSPTSRDNKCHTLYVQKAHFIAYYNSLTNVLLFMNNRIIYCSTPRRRDDSIFLFCVKPMLYPLPSRPIICMLSILSCCLCHFPALFLSLPVWYDLHVLCQAHPWSSEMESISRMCLSLLTANWRKGSNIKTSLNCLKGRQPNNYYRKKEVAVPSVFTLPTILSTAYKVFTSLFLSLVVQFK